MAPHFVPPVSIILAAARTRYIDGLTAFRGADVALWVERFVSASARAARLASAYVDAVRQLQARWRAQLSESGTAPRAGAEAWAIIGALPAHPVITGPTATVATGRVKTAAYAGIEQLVLAGVLLPLKTSKRNRSWEAVGLLNLVERLDSGEMPEARG